MDKYKIHRAVEYIRTQPEFPFDGTDIEESLEEVLAYFGLHPQLDEDERQELRQEILPMAAEDEETEVSRLLQLTDSALIGDTRWQTKIERRGRSRVVNLFTQPVMVEGFRSARQVVSPVSGENSP